MTYPSSAATNSPPPLFHSQPPAPATMADAAAGAAPLLPGLPNDISIWEILVRLPPKPLLRCRAVSPAWRRATSARDFLLSHHARQPALTLLDSYSDEDDGGVSLDLVPFDHRAAGVAAADRFQPVARLKPPRFGCERYPTMYLDASRDGLLLLSHYRDDGYDLCICNPATRQYAPLHLHQLKGFQFHPMGMYPHPPTGEYRLLLFGTGEYAGAYVFTLGSAQPPRHIGCHPVPLKLEDADGILFQGSIYWYTDYGILVFDTTNESFRHIRAPVGAPLARDDARVFTMGDMLAIFGPNDKGTAIDIWVMPNHQSEVWVFKCRVALPVPETRQQCQCSDHEQLVMVVPGDGGLLILITCDKWLFQVDIDGKLIASFQLPRGITAIHHVLKQSLVQHTFFPTLEGYVVNAPPLF